MRKLLMSGITLTLAASAFGADAPAAKKLSAPELIALAKAHSPQLQAAVEASFDAAKLKDGTAWAGRGPDFFFAV
jgi:hypothetical protein